MQTQAWVRNLNRPGEIGHYEYIDIPDDAIRRAAPQPQPQPVHFPAASRNSHPLLIAGIVIGLFLGILAILPPKARGVAVLAVIAAVIWFVWTASKDQAQTVGISDPAPRAELVKLPDYAPRAELVKLPRK